MTLYGGYGKIVAEKGKREELAALLTEASRNMVKNKECEIFSVSTSDEDPDAVFVYEVWASEDAHKKSLNMDVTRTLVSKTLPIITGMERLYTLDARK
ncbi:putative quinol monooxygenase [Jeotgalibacillus sp. R-1-5s-1]|uniref:putative quinol monooxygenase n=1 Tax=Jeotgalibacillus sp. R-1-5s-1 TaxID=2555897 RepID=UPI00141BEC67|nr:antibiotic biosynthesis monooxygenase [Jeotgalibacillus sp. R-1-5s-1]